MHFEICHEFDIPLDALELAVLSPDLVESLKLRLRDAPAVDQKEHDLEGHRMRRLWSFRGNVKVPSFAGRFENVGKDVWAWDERLDYDLRRHASDWTIVPRVKPGWEKYFSGGGSYQLFPLGAGRSKRVVSGRVELRLPVVRGVAEKRMYQELKRTFDAEAETLREMATLS